MSEKSGRASLAGASHKLPSPNYSQASSRPASAPYQGSGFSAAPTTTKPVVKKDNDKKNHKGGQPYIGTSKRVYPVIAEDAPPRPMSETNKQRMDRVQNKNYMLRQQFMGREQHERPASKGEAPIVYKPLPPYWSKQVHGEPGENIEVPMKIRSEVPLVGIKKSLWALRQSLATIPWPDGREVDDMERRIRAEISEMEDAMRAHIRRIVERIYRQSKAPSVTPKGILMRAFERLDVTRTGDVTVQEFAEVWNDPDKGLHLLVPVHKRAEDSSEDTLVNVKIKRDCSMSAALAAWERCDHFPLWGGTWELNDFEDPNGRLLLRPKEVLPAHAAGIFLKFGYDKDGLMPYEVFCSTLFTKPNRLLGMEPLMNQRAKGKHGFSEGDDFTFDGKILYQRAKRGVFPPSDFDSETAVRSTKLPSAQLRLEHVYGFSGIENTSNNLFYTDDHDEIVFYTAALGVVMNVRENKQRFFHGHNDNIKSMNMHPSDRIVATGQTKKVGPEEVPYVCIWEVKEMKQLQRLNHPFYTRAIVALAFSPDGEKLVTVGSDNQHSLFIWRWMTDNNKKRYLLGETVEEKTLFHWPVSIPSCGLGPKKKLEKMMKDPEGVFYKKANRMCATGEKLKDLPVSLDESGCTRRDDDGNELGPAPTGMVYVPPPPEDETPIPPPPEDENTKPGQDAWMKGADFELDPPEIFNAFNGAPPQVYGVVWNPYKENEFVTYGVKHLITWHYGVDENNPKGPKTWIKTAGSFGATKVMNVLAVAHVPDCMADHRETIRDRDTGKVFNRGYAKVTHSGKIIQFHRDPQDDEVVVAEEYVGDMGDPLDPSNVGNAAIFTGFPSGEVGMWLNGLMMRTIQAHSPGPKVILPDGTVTHEGVRVVKLRGDRRTLLTGGADGHVYQWDVAQTVPDQEWMSHHGARINLNSRSSGNQLQRQQSMARKQEGSALRSTSSLNAANSSVVLGRGALRMRRAEGVEWKMRSPFKEDSVPAFRALDSTRGSSTFIVGTNKNEIWEMEEGKEPRALINGATADIYCVAVHPKLPQYFATATEANILRVWDGEKREMERCMSVGFPCSGVAYSSDGSHLAVGGKFGHLQILSAGTLQPIVKFKDCVSSIDEIKYSPNNRIMACGSHDLYIDCYDTGFRGPAKSQGATGAVLRYPEVNSCWEKARGGKGEYVKLSRCCGHSASVCHLDFSFPDYNPPLPELRGKTMLVSNCNGYEILYWDPMTGQQILANPRNTKWATRTTLLGFDVMGIWPDGALTSAVNTLDRSNSQEYCVTGDNYSLVKLFNYPCVHDDAPWREYYGGASFITCARFTNDDRKVVAVGGNDRTVFQYATHGVNWDDCKGDPDKREELPWCDVEECLFCGRAPTPPPLPPPWGPLDAKGKTWGLVRVKAGVCSCANHELHMQQEFKNFDTDGNGSVSKLELKLVMQSCGVRLDDKDLDQLIKGADTDGDGQLMYDEFVSFWLNKTELENEKELEEQEKKTKASSVASS